MSARINYELDESVFEQNSGQIINDEQALNAQEANEDGKYVCKLCGNLFKHKADMKRHVQEKHWNMKAFQCLLCDYASFRKNTLTKHISIFCVLQSCNSSSCINYNDRYLILSIRSTFCIFYKVMVSVVMPGLVL